MNLYESIKNSLKEADIGYFKRETNRLANEIFTLAEEASNAGLPKLSTALENCYDMFPVGVDFISESEEPIEVIGFRIYITNEIAPGTYQSELYKEEYTKDIDRADDIVAELRAQGLNASREYIWNKEEDSEYDKYADETNWAAEEASDADERFENRYMGGGNGSTFAESSIPRNAKKIKIGDDEYFKDGPHWGKTSEKDLVIPKRYPIDQLKMQSRLNGKDIEVIETDPNYKPTRTKEIKVLQGNYGYGWDDLISCDASDQEELKTLREDLKAYRENEPQYNHRIITRREKI